MYLKSSPKQDFSRLARQIKRWGVELGFEAVGIAGVDLAEHEEYLLRWLRAGRHGQMGYMAEHGIKRSRPALLVPGTLRVISVRMNYLCETPGAAARALAERRRGYISRYALGRDYHKLMRRRLQRLAGRIADEVGEFGYRAFTDSAPVLEKALAQQAGLGWIGKHTNLIDRDHSSWFFLGELYTDLPLPPDAPAANHCGSCRRCIPACPTGAIVAPYELDARRCISYLTIELRGAIPEPLRPLVGNRIFGCDDCQLVCPWNKYAKLTAEPGFAPRVELTDRDLIELFAWSETEFSERTRGSAIRRIGYECWLRNVAVALGNAEPSPEATAALTARRAHPSPLVREHVEWALAQHDRPRTEGPAPNQLA